MPPGGERHRHGALRLTAVARDGRTVAAAQRVAFPAGTVRIRDVDGDGVGELQLTNPSGGLLAGDRMETVVDAGPGTRLSVVTQGANRVCGTARGAAPRTTAIEARVTVADGAVVEWAPHHLVPYARSRVRQRTTVQLAPSAGVVVWEALSTGRSARGERCAWDALDVRLRVTCGERPLLTDGAVLGPGGEPFDGADLAATFAVRLPVERPPDDRHRDVARGPAGRLADRLHEHAAAVPGVLGSASALDDRLVVGRVLARDAAALYALLAAWRAPARAAVGLPPPARAIG